jgi:UDP-glucose 4-epimerase
LDICVTGGSGFIGTHVVEALRKRGDNVRNVDLAAAAAEERADIRSASTLSRLLSPRPPEVIVHLAALASVPECERHPDDCFSHNVQGTWTVSSVAAALRARLVFASTAAVYGEPTQLPTPTSAPILPTNLYGRSKSVGEAIVRSFDPNATIFRVFNVYGPRCDRTYVIPDTIRKVRTGVDPVPMQGTGRESRDFVYVSDVVDAVERAIDHPRPGTYNLGQGETVTIAKLATAIGDLLGRPGIGFSFEGPRFGDFSINWADIRPPHALPGWSPQVRLQDGLERMIEEAGAGTRSGVSQD